MIKKNLASALVVCALTLQFGMASAAAGIINGGFETGDFSGWTTLGNMSVSTGASYGAAGSVNPESGTYSALLNSNNVSAANLAAAMGVSEATLEASNGGVDATNGSLLYQTVSANAGDTLSFNWNFVEQDYLPYDDWAFYGISVDGGPATVTKFASLGDVGPDPGTTVNGWETLTVNITQTGSYTFYFGIVNAIDFQLDSRLWMDGVSGSGSLGAVPEPTSLAIFGTICLFAGGRRRKS